MRAKDDTTETAHPSPHMAKDWTSPIYGFFESRPAIDENDRHRCHDFKCAAYIAREKG